MEICPAQNGKCGVRLHDKQLDREGLACNMQSNLNQSPKTATRRACYRLTCDLVSVCVFCNVFFVCDIFQAHMSYQLFDFVLAEFAVVVEEESTMGDGQVGMRLEVPDVLQVLIVEDNHGVPGRYSPL